MPRVLSLIVGVLLLSACQLLPTATQQQVQLGANARLSLQTSWRGAATQTLQQVIWSHPEHEPQTFLVSSWLSAEQIVMVGLSPLGQELWRVELGHQQPLTVTGIAPFDQPQLAQAIVADMQLQRWPVAELQTHLQGATLEQTPDGRHVVSDAGQVIWSSSTAKGTTTLRHHVAGYSLQLRTLDETGVPPDAAN
ncbi:DUF3261 domain-containing protein [Pseudidiomarina sp. E22-M8]|uniref:DUF3261 domain-containing protein n=1 Tax=Pseudidiomarina sp. E22-M8 TaxID=3424768 RepID=UPI00403C3E0F